uniref:3-dehydro-L-gulonate 2-dehydrogenase n=1 Tax=Acidobacterium capsulatum TaxID=33075 RepID=A0A7V5CSG3_9BACT
MLRISFHDLHRALATALTHVGFAPERAQLCARLFAETTLDGVYSHGVNRFPRFVAMIRNGAVDVHATPECISAFGSLERWDGHRGPGNLNAHAAMERALALSRAHGIGCVALRNTNHWMRGGSYGWQAANAGSIALCWTNTLPNLPAWGTREATVGNNPLILAVPRRAGHLVLDMAMSQFSYGALESYSRRGEHLPVPGGFDASGTLTHDPAAIEASQRPLPIGYWKGSGLALLLDAVAAVTALGNATHQLARDPLQETGLSQVFIAIHPAALDAAADTDRIADEIVASLHAAAPAEPGRPARYPGEQTLRLREENLRLGIPVEDSIWQQILAI